MIDNIKLIGIIIIVILIGMCLWLPLGYLNDKQGMTEDCRDCFLVSDQ